MTFVERSWLRLPTVLRAILSGLAVAALGTVPWAWLIAKNLEHHAALPWCVPIMAVYLALYWLYFVRGRGWPRATAEARRRAARVRGLPEEVWGAAILAGILGLASVLLLQGILGRLVTLPQQRDIDPARYPVATVFFWVLMSAVVSGVVEETSFRGYLQRPIERRHGLLVAIFVTGVLFGLSHYGHPEMALTLLPFYVAVAAVYGGLAYCTDSTLPSMVMHAGGNMLGAFSRFTTGHSEWQLASTPRPLVWQSGLDAAFWGNLAGLLVVGGLAVWAYRGLAAAARTARGTTQETTGG